MSGKLPSIAEILNRRQLPGLDGFRMIAVFSVILYHADIGSNLFTARHGVAGFFVLSGFLITWLLLKEQGLNGKVSLKDFYMRRALRIFPAYYVFVAITISWDMLRGNEEIKPLILPALFYYVNYHNAIEGHAAGSVAHLWSLAIEEQFYLLWPVLFIYLQQRGIETMTRFLCLAMIVVMVWRTAAVTVFDLGTSWAYNSFDTRFDNLATGCLLAVLIGSTRVQDTLQLLASRVWMPVVTLILLYLSRYIDSDFYAYGPAFTIDAILLAILLVQLMVLSHTKPYAWLNSAPVIYLGILSYPLYLWHLRGLEAGNKLVFLPEPMRVLAGVLCAIILAAISYHLLEKPFLRHKRKYQHHDKLE